MMKNLWLLGLAALALAACTFEDGRGWATVHLTAGAELNVDEAHSHDEATLATDRGNALTLDTLQLTVAGVTLLESSGGGGESISFDPASPPDGYTLCHGGHCHREDGALVDYEDIEAELAAAAGEEVLVPAEAFLCEAELDALAATGVDLGTHESGTVELAAVGLDVGAVLVTGSVGIEDGSTLPFVFELRADGDLQLQATLAEELGRGGAAEPDMELWWWPDPGLFDGIAFENLDVDAGTLRIDESHNESVLALVAARLAGGALDARITNP